jgi:conjugative transfer region lipoprotein (TIGR03751 family)
MKKILAVTLVSLISVVLTTGCATKDDILPQSGPLMSDVYYGHMATSHTLLDKSRVQLGGVVGDAETDLAGYTRHANNELKTHFPKLNNPELVMYVFPHLTKEGNPVPGYVSSFNLYAQSTLYALPGEVAR